MRGEEGPAFFSFWDKKMGYFLPLSPGFQEVKKTMVVNQKELAQCLGISSRRVRQLREEGLFHLSKVEKGYNLEKSIQEYIEYKVNAETWQH